MIKRAMMRKNIDIEPEYLIYVALKTLSPTEPLLFNNKVC